MKLNTNAFYIIAPLSLLSKRPRLYKLAKFVNNQLNRPLIHIGWQRLEEEEFEEGLDFEIKKKTILSGGGYGSKRLKVMYFIWAFRVFFHALRIKRGSVVWALGFESALPAILASKIRGFRVYFDDADRFSMLLNLGVLGKIIEFLERLTSWSSFMHIVPGLERYDYHSKKFFVLKNMPSYSEILEAERIFKEWQWPKDQVVININGWLGKDRGMDVALELSKQLMQLPVKILLLGRLASKEAEMLSKQANVVYYGSVSNAEALASYLASDFVLTYYDPRVRINKMAESNKWGDAIKLGIGIIVNIEVETSDYLVKSGATISLPYHDITGLVMKLHDMVRNKDEVERIKCRSKKLGDHFGFFEDQLQKIFSDFTEMSNSRMR